MNARSRTIAVVSLLALGVVIFVPLYLNRTQYDLSLFGKLPNIVDDRQWYERIALAIAVALTAIPFTRRYIAATFEYLRRPSPIVRRQVATFIAVFSGPILYGMGAAQNRLLLPIWHDENMYRLQTTFLSHGKLAMPGLAMPDFFETPYVFVRGVYAPVYFPGTALLHVPAALLHLPYWLTPLVIAVVSLVLLFLIISELIDNLAGVIAVILMISLLPFRWLALVEMSHGAGMMWGLLAMWSWLAWRKSPGARWAALGGFCAGFYALTRPLDAICILAPIAVVWLMDLRRVDRIVAFKSIFAAGLLIAPLLGFQLLFNRAITGHVLMAPLDQYNHIYFNARSLGLQTYDPAFRPPNDLVQFKNLYDVIDRPAILRFTTLHDAFCKWVRDPLATSLGASVPSLFIIILLPVSLLGLTDRRQVALWVSGWCMIGGMGFFYIFLQHYTASAASSLLFAIVLAASVLQRIWPKNPVASVFVPVALLALAGRNIAIDQQDFFEPMPGLITRANYREIPQRVEQPALVLFRFGEQELPWEEPVYNWDVLNPDDAPIIRAHDLGPKRDLQLLRYYKNRKPALHVYLYDRVKHRLEPLGTLDHVIESMARQAVNPSESPAAMP
jgi:hypothetical protein